MKSLLGSIFFKIKNQINICISSSQKNLFNTSKSDIHKSFRLGTDNQIYIDSSARIIIDKDVTINQHNFITIKKNASLQIGANTYITRATISCLGEITIGQNCILGEGMKLFDHNHQYTKEPFSVSKTEFNIGKITLGNNVWTGANVTVLKDVVIGNNVIIGAGCVIHKNVPDNTIIINNQEHKIIEI